MTKKLKTTDVVFLLDRSGSMVGTEKDTIGGYNNYIKHFKNKNANITTILFDDRYEMLTKREDVSKVKELTEKQYFVRGSTALLDAIGKTIYFLEEEKSENVIFIITTDGYENSSRNFTKEQIKEMITAHKEWEFMYIGADIDSYSEGQSLGIKQSNIGNYKKDKKGISSLFNTMFCVCEEYVETGTISYDWKDQLENYIDDNKITKNSNDIPEW